MRCEAVRNLMRANLRRLGRDPVFHVLLLTVAFLAARRACVDVSDWTAPDRLARWYDTLLSFVSVLGPLLSILSGWFVGGEYAGGAMRNRVIAGHSRTEIFLTSFLTMAAGALGMMLLYHAAVLLCGLPQYGLPVPEARFLVQELAVLFTGLAWCAVFTAAALNGTGPVISLLLCLELTGGMYLAANRFSAVVLQAENPLTEHSVARFLFDFLPAGQAEQLRFWGTSNLNAPAERLLPMEVLFTAVALGLGILLFRRRDLN